MSECPGEAEWPDAVTLAQLVAAERKRSGQNQTNFGLEKSQKRQPGSFSAGWTLCETILGGRMPLRFTQESVLHNSSRNQVLLLALLTRF